MAELIRNINSFEEFGYLRENYKRISKLSQKELKFYLLNLENGNSLISILDFLVKNPRNSKIEYKLIDKTEDKELINLKILKRFEEEYSEAIMYWDKNSSNVILMSDESKEKIDIVKRFAGNIFPYATKKFIKSYEIRNIIKKFREDGYQITASMISTKRWWEKVKTSGVKYTKEVPIDKILEDLDKQKSFINSISFKVFDKNKKNQLLRAYVSRKGLVKFIDGFYELFEKNILNPLINENENEKKLLVKRERELEAVKPLRMSFERLEGFSSIEITKQFAQSVSKTRELSLAVMHNGNPYFYASITNNFDGSVFDVIFQNTGKGSELIVIPQYSVSSNSLSKFFSLVYSQFGEGQISEYHID